MLAAALAAWLGLCGFDAFLAVFPWPPWFGRPSRVFVFHRPGRRRDPAHFEIPRHRLLSDSSWMFGVEIVAVAYFRVDIFMLSKMVDLRATGLYRRHTRSLTSLSPCSPAT
jgi:O-antigen/teichoic acid export membrane protein